MTLIRRLALLLVLAGLVHAQQDVSTALDSIAAGWARQRGFMGAILAAKDGKIVIDKAYGMANVEWEIPATTDARFRLGSITKQFTAAAVLQLEEQGRLSVADSISKYVPDCPEAWKPITIHQLLNHTSGIVSYTGMPEFGTAKLRRVPLAPLEIVMLSKDKPLEFQPGEGWKYNNTGYVLLGHIIEKVAGVKYDEYLRKHIFDPLDMKDSGYDWTRPVLKHRASGYGYNRTTRAYTNADFLDMSLPHAAGSLYSTVRDLYRWDRALYGDRVLDKASIARMFTAGREDYAYGWVVRTVNGRKEIGHGGGINGFSTMISRYPEQDAVVIVLSNVENGDAGGLSRYLARALFGEKVQLPWERKAIDLDPKVFSRYTGQYQLPPFKVTVTAEEGKLMMQPDGQPKLQLFPETESHFFVQPVDATVEFILAPDETATELVLRQGGREIRGKRIPLE